MTQTAQKTQKNSIGREVPLKLLDCRDAIPYDGPWARLERGDVLVRTAPPLVGIPRGTNKVTDDVKEAIRRSGLENGMTISFHHHLRNGDATVALILTACEEMGLKDLVLAPSSLSEVHDPVAGFVRRGVVSRIHTSGVRGEVGKLISRGELEIPVMIHSHGGRARAIEDGTIEIDVAFLAAPTCDEAGNFTGAIGKSACGSIGYAMQDARYAKHVIAVTDNLLSHRLSHVSVPQYLVNQVLVVDSLGDPRKIASGAVRLTRNPVERRIAQDAFDLIVASGSFVPGFSIQMGSGGASLGVAANMRDYMRVKKIKGNFACGGMTGHMVEMLEEGLFDVLYDVQSFDSAVTTSVANNPGHVEIDQSCYANPLNRGCVAHGLDVVILAALDVDTDFNVNVLTGHDGVLRGASGGHCDTAAGAKLSIVVLPSFRGGVCSIKERVLTVVTPGETVDAIVTERGICINPRRPELAAAARKAGLNVMELGELKESVERLTGRAEPIQPDRSRTVALVEYRDGTILDSVYRVDC